MNTVDRSKLKEKYGDEKVLVVKTSDLPAMTEGFVERSEFVVQAIADKTFFIPRYEAEYNPEFRQLIPYVVVRYKKDIPTKYFALQRLKGSGEARLVSNITMGIGGHINPIDKDEYSSNSMTTIFNAMNREVVQEELDIKDTNCITDIKFLGLINDTSNEVGKDHLGLVYIVDVANNEITVKETDKHTGSWHTIWDLVADYEALENWSKIVLKQING